MYGENCWDWQTWKSRIFVFLFLISTLCLTTIPLWNIIGIHPSLILIILYHWILYRPDLLPIEQLILVSLIQDGLYAYPLGFSTVRLLIDYMLLLIQKRFFYPQRFSWTWGGFGVFLIIDSLIYAGLLSCIKHEWVGISSLFPGIGMTLALYPLTVWMTHHLVKKFLTE